MTERKEFKGDTVAQAKETAAVYFGVEPDDLEFRVLFDAGQGVVGGVAGGKAIIVAVPKGAAAPPEEPRSELSQSYPRGDYPRGERHRERPSGMPDRRGGRGGGFARDSRSRPGRPPQREGREGGGQRWRERSEPSQGNRPERHREDDRSLPPRREPPQRSEQPPRAEPSPRAEQPEGAPSQLKDSLLGEGPYGVLSDGVPAIASQAEEVLREVLDKTGLGAGLAITARENDEEVYLDAKGDGSGLIIGKAGQTLDALQYIVAKIVHRKTQVKKRVFVDCEGYRRRQVAQLRDLAVMLSDKAKSAGRAIEMEPMNSFDRRIVHVTLENEPGISTMSIGEGEFKKLIITPQERARR